MSKVFTIMEGLENMGALRTGGQGSVYKGRRMGPILSAVNLLPTPIYNESLEDKNYRNFLNEVEKLKKVNEEPNPNVVKIISSGVTESGSLPFIEMEFIEGPDLAELLVEPHDKVFTVKEVIKLADQLAGALAHCHKVGIKHGDIKSNNVKFNIHTGNYVLLDFGLSVMSDEERRSSMRHAGAIEFMAPEQNEGKVQLETDIYSYGVILYELLAGQVPFPLKDNGETARNTVMISHMESPLPDMLALRKQNLPVSWDKEKQVREMLVPGWLINIIYKCLEKQPTARYANGMELQQAIINNSIAADPDNHLVVLKTENDALQSQLMQLQEAAVITKRTNISIPQKVFKGAIAAMAVLLIVSIYSLFKPRVVYQPIYNKNPYVPFVLQPIKPPVHIVTKYIRDSTAFAERARTNPVPEKKHRRKKFLGIF